MDVPFSRRSKVRWNLEWSSQIASRGTHQFAPSQLFQRKMSPEAVEQMLCIRMRVQFKRPSACACCVCRYVCVHVCFPVGARAYISVCVCVSEWVYLENDLTCTPRRRAGRCLQHVFLGFPAPCTLEKFVCDVYVRAVMY